MSNEPLLRGHGIGFDNLHGNLVESFEFSEDNTEFTFTLRRGLRWSDGVPVTTADVAFAINDVMKNTEINPIFPGAFRSGGRADGELVDLEVVDDYTFILRFAEPSGQVAAQFAGWWGGYDALLRPKHYLQQFHIDYTSLEDMREALDAEELDDEWWQLFDVKNITGHHLTRRAAVDMPVLRPWMRVESASGTIRMERNPYYHKVDIEGNQLPYIDSIYSHEVGDTTMVEMRALTGESDWLRGATSLSSMELYRGEEERGGYTTLVLEQHVTPVAMTLNLTYEDESWRQVVRDPRFRQALNMSIDREELIETVYFGIAEYPVLTDPTWDPERAEELLDEMGMAERGSDGFRLTPDGESFEITIEYSDLASDFTPVAELLKEYYESVGIRTDIRLISEELRALRNTGNELKATLIWLHPPLWRRGFNFDWGPWLWGPLWNDWYNSGGEQGEEPPTEVQEFLGLLEAVNETAPGTPADQANLDAVFEWIGEFIPFFLPIDRAGYPLLVSDQLRNVPHTGLSIDAEYIAEQFYFVEE